MSNTVDWSKTSTDYARHRAGFPDRFFVRLTERGLQRPGQRVLDVGTGTGAVALPLAARGAQVTAIDPAEGQLAQGRARAEAAGLSVDFRCARGEETGLPDAHFDLIAAFDADLSALLATLGDGPFQIPHRVFIAYGRKP
ncbi:MAG: class I SAM-dependent methyltransferase [Bradymonadia bacterium]